MKNSFIEILIALVLGILFPVLLFALMSCLIPELHDTDEFQQTANFYQNQDVNECFVDILIEDVVKKLPLEEYIVYVVLREMPADFHEEALKAQAVVARTYTVKQILNGGKHNNADVCADSDCCQGYWEADEYLDSGGTRMKLDRIQSAVEATKGELLLYEGSPIEATYFSCSGGNTEDAVAVWGKDVPYLRATSSPGEENAKHYTDTVWFSVQELAQKLGVRVNSALDFNVGKITYTSGGGVDTIDICGKKYQGTTIRKLLDLRSTAFIISVAGDRVTITTKGFGHRVGMSQYGAEAMAVKGKTYRDILQHYYTGVSLMTLDELC